MAMTALQQQAAGIGQAVLVLCQNGVEQNHTRLLQWLAAAINILAQSAGGDNPTVNLPTTLPTVADNSAINVPGM